MNKINIIYEKLSILQEAWEGAHPNQKAKWIQRINQELDKLNAATNNN